MSRINPEQKKEIWLLYFNKKYSYTQIMEFYNNKFTYPEIKMVINEKLK